MSGQYLDLGPRIGASVALCLLAAIGSVSASHAQSTDLLLPPISTAKARYFVQHPQAYQAFLSQLPRRPAEPVKTAAAHVAPVTVGGTWIALPAAPSPASLYAPHLLTDGTVLVENSTNPQWYKLTPDINGSYVNGTWSSIAALPIIGGQQYAPLYHASAVLPDGRLVIIGGEYNAAQVNASGKGNVLTNLGAIYDPIADAWTAVAPPANLSGALTGYDGVIGDAQSVVLANGTFLLGGCCASPDANDLFNAATLGWTATAAPGDQYQDEQGYHLLPNGNVLTLDIWGTTNPTSTEQYVPSSGTWIAAGNTPVSLVDPCGNGEVGPAILRPDGTVVAFGGYALASCGTPPPPGTQDPTAIYNTGSGIWSIGPGVPTTCNAANTQGCTLADSAAALLPNGNVLFAASAGYTAAPTHFFEYTAANTINQVSDPLFNASGNPAYVYNFVVLPSGQILMTDGSNTPEVYTPAAGVAAGAFPIVSAAPPVVIAGDSYPISGNQFSGVSEGAGYGDDAQTSTNYPIVRITNAATGHVFYARTFNHSTRSVAPGAAGSTSFTVPLKIEPGPSKLVVIANGVASTPATVSVKFASTVFPPDFNGDGTSDILWISATDMGIWQMQGGAFSAWKDLGAPPTGWTIAGTGDFNGDGTSDILWTSATNMGIWIMQKGAFSSWSNLGAPPGNGWTIAGTGDFNGDGTSDILWRNTQTGAAGIWIMKGGAFSSWVDLGVVPKSYTIAGTGDFNGDGTTDILWTSATDLGIWIMHNGAFSAWKDLGPPATGWSVTGTADFNGDGTTDILWTSATEMGIWIMQNGAFSAWKDLGAPPGNGWSVAGTGDFNAGGTADILWRNSNGEVGLWIIKGGAFSSYVDLGGVPTFWSLVQ